MAKKKTKYYVVWEGMNTGIFTSWDECLRNVKGYPKAKYKSYERREEAEDAFRNGYHIAQQEAKEQAKKPQLRTEHLGQLSLPALCVDAACSGNPGLVEYRGVWLDEAGGQKEIFRQGPFRQGTNNIGEFLALVHGLALLDKQQVQAPIYSDSRTAMSWVRKKSCRSKLQKTAQNQEIFALVERAELWLNNNPIRQEILKWDTKTWGEIPADFGRK